ncbi:hypothetical protein ACI796_03800 [Geodermatophilus sp. SYSU D00525]
MNEAAASPTRDHGNGGFLWPHDWRHAQAAINGLTATVPVDIRRSVSSDSWAPSVIQIDTNERPGLVNRQLDGDEADAVAAPVPD